ncbi:hypothetical protein Ssi03_59370 [Sphaerisporangium siamense]|uniref:Uncharacterized protein n=1 Tax=Sphaerisporangium siamense TaxID=795645 RepID=A0A7W7D3S7_9ACTN|nr:hypothetical protein [Sphaerisporangium siamense]MBB4699767.1 hypothetical protein [Sphaerisporangium siamense]GII87947.1 hypothetical protein Ssi03_59370 [Sphaerisporangium siamense]
MEAKPRRWDPAERAAAAQLDQLEPGWFVTYGVGSRRFVAIAAWRVPSPLRIETASIKELRELMREAESEAARPGELWTRVA